MIPIVWCVCFLASLGGAGVVANTVGVQMDVGQVEQFIESDLQSEFSASFDVQCPSSVAARPGSTFQCVVEGAGVSSLADVTVQNSNGDIVWQVR